MSALDELVLELLADVADDLDAITAPLFDVLDRVDVVLGAVTWDSRTENEPADARRITQALQAISDRARPS